MTNKLAQRLAAKTQGLDRQADSEKQANQKPLANADMPSSAVETAPAAGNPARTPRPPTTMPGQLGAFRNEAQKYVEQIAERDKIIEELKSSTDRVQRIQLSHVVDSPFQPRIEYDPEEIDALAKTMAAATQADPIKVRMVGDKFELISGHRRKRAALSLGWSEIDAIVEVRTDKEAEIEAMLLVVGNVQLSDYELAKMYRRALDKGYCKSNREAAAMFGVAHTAVNARLDMLALPTPILEMLEAKPSLFSYSTSIVIKDLIKRFPRQLDIIVQAVRRLVEEGASQSSIASWVPQAIAAAGKRASPRPAPRIVTKDGREVFTTKSTANSVTVSIKAKDVNNDQFEKDLHDWLTSYANGSKHA